MGCILITVLRAQLEKIGRRIKIKGPLNISGFNCPFPFSRIQDVDKVKVILDRPSTNINAVNIDGRTPLHIAAITDNRECIERLLHHRKTGILRFVVPRSKREDEMIDCNVRDNGGKTPLILAIQNDCSEAANLIMPKLSLTTEEWKDIWSNCQSIKMKKILEKHCRSTVEKEGDDLNYLCSGLSNETKVILRLPGMFKNLLSLLLDKLQAIYPSHIIFISKLTNSNISFKNLKIKEDKKSENVHSGSVKLDSGIELKYVDLINDIRLHTDICLSLKKEDLQKSNNQINSTYAHEYIRELIRKKLPV